MSSLLTSGMGANGMAEEDYRYDVIWLVRRLFQAMAQASNRILADFEINVSQRAVLEFLYPKQRMTMSEVARKHNVSRQHIQVLAQDLLSMGLLESQPNPESKRAPHLSLSPQGRKLFQSIRRKEARLMDALFDDLSARNIKMTRKTLQGLLRNTHSLIDQMKGDE